MNWSNVMGYGFQLLFFGFIAIVLLLIVLYVLIKKRRSK